MRIVKSDTGVTRLEVGPLTPNDAAHVASMAYNDTKSVPPTYFPAANPQASWLNEVTRAIEEGSALGLWLGPSGSEVQGPPVGAVIARRKPGFDGLTLLYATKTDEQRGGTTLIDAARELAAQAGLTVARLVVIPAKVVYDPI